jgi:hypothetical protein
LDARNLRSSQLRVAGRLRSIGTARLQTNHLSGWSVTAQYLLLYRTCSDQRHAVLHRAPEGTSSEDRLPGRVHCVSEEAQHRIRSALRMGVNFGRPYGAALRYLGYFPLLPPGERTAKPFQTASRSST